MKAGGCVGDASHRMTFRLQRCPVRHRRQSPPRRPPSLHNGTLKPRSHRCFHNKEVAEVLSVFWGVQDQTGTRGTRPEPCLRRGRALASLARVLLRGHP